MNLVKYIISSKIVSGCFVKLKPWITKEDLSKYRVKIQDLNARDFEDFKNKTHRVRSVKDICLYLYEQPYCWVNYIFDKVYPAGITLDQLYKRGIL